MHEPTENRSVKSLFAVIIIVGHYTENGYITLILSVMTLIAEICDKLKIIITFPQTYVIIREGENI